MTAPLGEATDHPRGILQEASDPVHRVGIDNEASRNNKT